jgi:hypothetical protein
MNKLIGFLLTICIITADAQSVPVGRATAHLFYFPPLKSPVLIDGYEKLDDSPEQSEVWQLKNGKWIRIVQGSYESRKLTAAAFDSNKNEIFTFGGIGKVGYDFKKSDGFIFDGAKWRAVSSDIGTRDHHEMVYASHLKSYVMYGGVNAERKYDSSTWLFRNGKWEPLNIPGPRERVHHAMAYDPIRKKVVLYGGGGDKKQYRDTWEFDGERWIKIIAESQPGTKSRHTMTYDPSRKVILLLSGRELWSWDGVSWKLLSSDAPDRMMSAVCFDANRNRVVLFGGVENEGDQAMRGDTWEWDGRIWTQVISGETWRWNNELSKYVILKQSSRN